MLSLLMCLLYIAIYLGFIDQNSPYYQYFNVDGLQEDQEMQELQERIVAGKEARFVQAEENKAKCEFPELSLPKEFVIYATGGYSGRITNFSIDQSGHTATQFDVTVNNINKPVVLMLGAYEPSIWNINWTKGTKIVGIFASGYHKQVIVGIDSNIPILISSYDNRGNCGSLYLEREKLAEFNQLSSHLFGKPIDKMYFEADEGRVLMGNEHRQEAVVLTSPKYYDDSTAPKSGQLGLDNAVASGLIRTSTVEDENAWLEQTGKNGPKGNYGTKAYVVLQPFTFPAGLFGAHRVIFIIPKGVPYPRGNPGHSDIYDFNTLQCTGPGCYSR